ncbi:hypothetical protein KY285_003627 [Solanum tuberosum]|uniref:Uncharacterized protein n=1 Tax=Solanum tuberosum TaxID=4113 RepID=M1C4S9_SOLTU|nr:hypothetical protein KY289_034582 [Solanum tuberosum]KAH0727926.1 hypothetical protein KY284_003791 [Solanum tuberosum]KAH0732783.1 hypothetical protein KY289_003971 [Solanum tuberosum]KAH0767756.1 hypothetical protein KY285_003627 [Solanum tuberosum]
MGIGADFIVMWLTFLCSAIIAIGAKGFNQIHIYQRQLQLMFQVQRQARTEVNLKVAEYVKTGPVASNGNEA